MTSPGASTCQYGDTCSTWLLRIIDFKGNLSVLTKHWVLISLSKLSEHNAILEKWIKHIHWFWWLGTFKWDNICTAKMWYIWKLIFNYNTSTTQKTWTRKINCWYGTCPSVVADWILCIKYILLQLHHKISGGILSRQPSSAIPANFKPWLT